MKTRLLICAEDGARPRASRVAPAQGGGRALSGGAHRTLVAIFALILATPVQALTAMDCDRTTHISHGGEADHMDLGEGRVMWRDWWSQEGTATDFTIADCASGEALSFRTAEERMNKRLPFDRTAKALRRVEDAHAGARVFATLPRIADALENIARDIEITTLQVEPCACAALYPDLQGTKTKFVLEG